MHHWTAEKSPQQGAHQVAWSPLRSILLTCETLGVASPTDPHSAPVEGATTGIRDTPDARTAAPLIQSRWRVDNS